MITFGMPTLIETRSPEDCARLCCTLGLRFIEINMNLPEYQPHRLNAGRLHKIAQDYNFFYTIHLDENLNPTDFNRHVALAYRETVMETIALAKEIGAPVLNMHLHRGVYFTLPDRKVYLFDEYWQEYLESMLAFRQECARHIGDSGIRICIENCDGFTSFQQEAVDMLLENDVFGLTLDTGHAYCSGSADEPFILARRLCHMHLHDAVAGSNHLTLGTGETDIPKYLSLARAHNCRVVLETKTIESLTRSCEYLRAKNLL